MPAGPRRSCGNRRCRRFAATPALSAPAVVDPRERATIPALFATRSIHSGAIASTDTSFESNVSPAQFRQDRGSAECVAKHWQPPQGRVRPVVEHSLNCSLQIHRTVKFIARLFAFRRCFLSTLLLQRCESWTAQASKRRRIDRRCLERAAMIVARERDTAYKAPVLALRSRLTCSFRDERWRDSEEVHRRGQIRYAP